MERRKIILTLLLACVVSSLCMAQFSRKPFIDFKNLKNSSFHFGILLQYNQPWYYIEQSNSFLRSDTMWAINVKNGSGISLGITFDWNINRYIQFRTNIAQLVLDYREVEYRLQYPDFRESPIENKVIETPYLQWPFLIKWQSDVIAEKFRVYMFLGGMINIDIGDKKLQTIRNLSIKNNDLGVLGGIGFHLYFRTITISPQLQFSVGTTNLVDTESVSKFTQNINAIYNRSLSFGIVISP